MNTIMTHRGKKTTAGIAMPDYAGFPAHSLDLERRIEESA
ncbi:hypothetical protein BQ8420_19165 [Nocardiopsis sp. JB363]|nr:hypothetical protein BQ8420_19165 [Nocardiopsis sp. JB363]